MTEVWIAESWLAYQDQHVVGVFTIEHLDDAKLACAAETESELMWAQGDDGNWETTNSEWSGFTITKWSVK